MDSRNKTNSRRKRILKLSLKKNTIIQDEPKKLNRSSDVILLEESFDNLKTEFQRHINPEKICSPIVIDDSYESDTEILKDITDKPSRVGNISFNCSDDFLDDKPPHPSYGGWSPAQHYISTTPHHNIPSTPKDIANKSLEQCSIKKIQQSQKKILEDLYGEALKTMPALFKFKHDNFDGISKKLQFEDKDEDKENIHTNLKINKELYLTNSDTKRYESNFGDTTKKLKKKLYTEKVPNTPDIKIKNTRNINSTSKKTKVNKAMSVTEMVDIMKNNTVVENPTIDYSTKPKTLIQTKLFDSTKKVGKIISEDTKKRSLNIDTLSNKIEKIALSPFDNVKRLSFMASLGENVPSWRCHPEAIQYHDKYKILREQLTRRLYVEFNKTVFDDALDADMCITWDSKLRSTAGTATNRLIKTSKGDRIRTSSIKLSMKVVDAPHRLRDTLIHEMCHAATWLVDADLRAGHGPLWKNWAKRALRIYPELGEISTCHDMEIHFKYSYKCTKCGYSIQRHSKSIDVTKKCCAYCRGTFEVVINKKNRDGVVISTPARKVGPNEFAKYVKDNYALNKDGTKSHAQVMKILGEQFSAKKSKPIAKVPV